MILAGQLAKITPRLAAADHEGATRIVLIRAGPHRPWLALAAFSSARPAPFFNSGNLQWKPRDLISLANARCHNGRDSQSRRPSVISCTSLWRDVEFCKILGCKLLKVVLTLFNNHSELIRGND